jgi:hypothetical protein
MLIGFARMVNSRFSREDRQMSIQALMAVPSEDRDVQWLAYSLQEAVQLEWTTIPPYLCAYWSIKTDDVPEPTATIRDTFRQIVIQEMLHLGLACNMLAGMGGTPNIYSENFAPKYPGVLPSHVHTGLVIGLAGLARDQPGDKQQVAKFMEIELPEAPLAPMAAGFPTIGAFYDAICDQFDRVNPKLSPDRQLTNDQLPDLIVVGSPAEAKQKIDLIKRQGEGTACSPFDDDKKVTIVPRGELAHYYRFGEIHAEHCIRPDPKAPKGWSFTGKPLPFPDARNLYLMAEVPPGGYPESTAFDRVYTKLLKMLYTAWAEGDSNILANAVGLMDSDLSQAALDLLRAEYPGPSGRGIKGPDFRFVPT